MGFTRQEYWSGLLRPPPGDLPDLEKLGRSCLLSLMSPALASVFFTTSTIWEALNSVRAETGEEAAEGKVWRKSDWVIRLKERSHLHNIKVWGETAIADVEATASYPWDPAKIIHEGGSTAHEYFCGDETTFFWKKIPSGDLPRWRWGKDCLPMQEMQVQCLGQEDPLV